MTRPPALVDDFLGLSDLPLAGVRTMVLHGRSGSGKSTLLRHLLATHLAYRNEAVTTLDARPMRWQEAHTVQDRLVLVDEVLEYRELLNVAGLLRRGCRVLVASHLPSWAHLPLRAFGPLRMFATDQDHEKLGRYLRGRGIQADVASLRAYVRRYGATYTDLDILFERCPAPDLGQALRRFERHNRIELTPNQERSG